MFNYSVGLVLKGFIQIGKCMLSNLQHAKIQNFDPHHDEDDNDDDDDDDELFLWYG